jgi:hypothetical protein
MPMESCNNHAKAFMKVVTSMIPRKEPVSWAKINFTGDIAVASTRAKLVNQATLDPID